jgi:hypothetical protein
VSGLRQALLHFIDERIAQMLARPAAWGSAESVELQVLQLVEVRALAMHPDADPQRTFKLLQRAYERFIESSIEGTGPEPLAALLEQRDRLPELGPLLGRFVAGWEYAQRDDNPFEEHDLVLRLTLREKYDDPPAGVIGHSYETFRRVIRAIEQDSPMGRVSPGVEYSTEFRMPDLQILRRNGAPARVVLPLRIPVPDHVIFSADMLEGAHRVRSAISHLAALAEWAAGGSSTAELSQILPDTERRQRIAFQALRLLPGADAPCTLVELGGKEISRLRPVAFSQAMSPRFFDVVSAGQVSTAFDVTGIVRMLDLDQGTLALKATSSPKRTVYWLRLDEPQMPAALLDVEVRLQGNIYRDSLQHTFAVATKLELIGPADKLDDGDARSL